MASKQYVTMEEFEKRQLHLAKERDPRFAQPSRIADGAYCALLAQQAMEEFQQEADG